MRTLSRKSRLNFNWETRATTCFEGHGSTVISQKTGVATSVLGSIIRATPEVGQIPTRVAMPNG